VERIVREVQQETSTAEVELPMAITSALDTPPTELRENFKNYKRQRQRYYDGFWTVPESMDKQLTPELKKAKVDVHQVTNLLYKNTTTTRTQAKAATELYEQLSFVANKIRFDNEQDQRTFQDCIKQAEQLAVYSWGSAHFQDVETKEFTLKHTSGDDGGRTRSAFGAEFIESLNKGRFEHQLLNKASGSYGNRGGFNRFQSRGYGSRGRGYSNYNRGSGFQSRGRGRGATYSPQQFSTNPNQPTDSNQ
jgi:hypothetical protein